MTVTVVELLEGNNAFPIVFLGNYQHIDATKSTTITPYRKMQTLKHVPDSRTANAFQITFWSFIAKGNLNQLFDLPFFFFCLGTLLLSLNVTEKPEGVFWFIFFLFLCAYVHVVMQFFISGEILKCQSGWWVVDTVNTATQTTTGKHAERVE